MTLAIALQVRQNKRLFNSIEQLMTDAQEKAEREEELHLHLEHAVKKVTAKLELITEGTNTASVTQQNMMMSIQEVSMGAHRQTAHVHEIVESTQATIWTKLFKWYNS